MVNVRLYPLHPALTKYIRHIWTLDLSFPGEPIDLNMTGDCYPHLVIQCREGLKGLWLPAREHNVPAVTLKGISLNSKVYKMSANYSHIAVSFYPDGIKNIFGIDAFEVVNQAVDAGELLPAFFSDRINDFATHEQRAGYINEVLVQMLWQRRKEQDKRVADFLKSPHASYSEKLKEYNISERHFSRLFTEYVGIRPSLYRRLSRFEETLAAIRNTEFRSLTDLAYQFGYADQAHFCREFKSFTGETPHAFLRKDRIHEDKGIVDRPDNAGHLMGASI
ncbi:MAG TPA: helix-turn-helix domain-containing protein [Niabella sp.]|nr:helix-turn-helix domain-containing protein [Niabella sp.]